MRVCVCVCVGEGARRIYVSVCRCPWTSLHERPVKVHAQWQDSSEGPGPAGRPPAGDPGLASLLRHDAEAAVRHVPPSAMGCSAACCVPKTATARAM